jgi:hypothetical protein
MLAELDSKKETYYDIIKRIALQKNIELLNVLC